MSILCAFKWENELMQLQIIRISGSDWQVAFCGRISAHDAAEACRACASQACHLPALSISEQRRTRLRWSFIKHSNTGGSLCDRATNSVW
ncbi:hypothetical protein AGR9A_Cc80234 [Agrobacterium salinitolerans str. Hayward 0363]|nr:hypothetical protein AGR9A_Cc80234 [Agrobacterium salinitolerans str. Hayward 0363]